MTSQKDYFSLSTHPRVREDLTIASQVVGGIQTYMVKDPLNRAYHRIGEAEYTILTLLDGERSFNQIKEEFHEIRRGMILDRKNFEDFIKYLKEADLLEKSKVQKSILFYQKMIEMRRRKLCGRLGVKNILELTFPAFDPNKLFDRIIHALRFLWSKGFLIFSCFCFVLAILISSYNWETFKEATFGLYTFKGKTIFDFILIYVLFFVIVIIHECAHGLTCKYYGGEVHELGFILYYFQPCFYCQVDDAYLFENKYQRIAVMTSGAYSELIICSLAIFVWWLTPSHTFIHFLSAYLMALTGFIAVIFNFNPLMKYDGYYILSDYLEILNLREESFGYLSKWFKGNILKIPVEEIDLSPRLKKIYMIYGVSAILYSGFILVVVFIMAKNFLVSHYHIWGTLILLTLFSFIFRKKAKILWSTLREFARNRKIFLYVRNYPVPFLLGFLILLYGLCFVKIDWQIRKDFVIVPKHRIQVRSLNDGFIREVFVEEGDDVVQNQLLAIIDNNSLQIHINSLRKELNLISQRVREHNISNNVQLLKAYYNEKRILEFELKNAETKLRKFNIVAPTNGKVLTPRMQEKLGAFIHTGGVFCELVDLSKLQAKISLLQWEVGDVKENDRVKLKISSEISQIEGIIDKLLLIPQGSELSFYEARVDIENSKERIKPGMTGTAKIICGKLSLASYFYRNIIRSIRTELWK